MERKPCRRCLLQDIDESQLMEAIQQRIAALPASQRASAEDYAARLSECRMCDFWSAVPARNAAVMSNSGRRREAHIVRMKNHVGDGNCNLDV